MNSEISLALRKMSDALSRFKECLHHPLTQLERGRENDNS